VPAIVVAVASVFAVSAAVAYGLHQASSSSCLSWRLAHTHPAAKNMTDAGDYNGRTLAAAHYSGLFSV
jgi:hypothetical protein